MNTSYQSETKTFRRFPAIAVIAGLLLTILSGAETQAQVANVFDSGVALVVKTTGVEGEARASGAIVKEKVGDVVRYFLVTAYHNLAYAIECQLAPHAISSIGTVTLFPTSDTKLGFGGEVYCNVPSDLAIIEIVSDFGVGRKLRVDQTALALLDENLTYRGSSAAAFGQPTANSEVFGAGIISAVAFHCTISRHDELRRILDAGRVLGHHLTISGISADQLRLANTVRERRFVLVETMSITHGFSGTAVVVSEDQFRSPDRS